MRIAGESVKRNRTACAECGQKVFRAGFCTDHYIRKSSPKTLAYHNNNKRANKDKEAKLRVMWHYCFGEPHCQCSWCPIKHIEFLQIDHIDGSGFMHVSGEGKNPNRRLDGPHLIRWIIKNNFPPGFQVLCCNCNFAKGNKNKCPFFGKKHF
jgi:hypothetical protein